MNELVESIVDWKRIAAPQKDGYDTDYVLTRIQKKLGKKTKIDSFESEKQSPNHMFAGAVGVDYIPGTFLDRFSNADPNHENIKIAESYLKKWPEVYQQFKRIIHTFHPWLDAEMEEGRLGSCSHSKDELLGVVYATVNNAEGLAQAFVHEMAHNKLRSIGVLLESADSLILNSPDELFDSPIRKDCKRPMTAVFHAQYSFMHVTALNCVCAKKATSEEERMKWLTLLKNNIPRMQEGDIEIKKHLKMNDDGKDFFNGFFNWSSNVIEEGKRLLKKENS